MNAQTATADLSEYTALIERMRQVGVSQLAAEKFARARYPTVADALAAQDEQRDTVLEKEEQREIAKLFRAFGFEVYWLSQARAAKQTPGLPDLWLMHREQPIGFWWETKRATGGRFSEAQIRFRETCERCGVGYGCGDRRDARHHLVRLGVAQLAGGDLIPARTAEAL